MTLETALVSCTVLGLQHGTDWDHLAAISDVSSVQLNCHEAARCGLLYAVGHAATVGLLGMAAILLRHSLPGAVSNWMERIVGLSLILMGVYVLTTLFTGAAPMNRSQAICALLGRLRSHRTGQIPNRDGCYGRKSSLSLGVVHGIGAETPTQISMLFITANLGGLGNGALGLAAFTTAMFASNMALTMAAAGAFTVSRNRPAALRFLGVSTAAYSLYVGIAMVR